jgi:hypothetical protein
MRVGEMLTKGGKKETLPTPGNDHGQTVEDWQGASRNDAITPAKGIPSLAIKSMPRARSGGSDT